MCVCVGGGGGVAMSVILKGIAQWLEHGLVIKRSRVRIPAGELSSPWSTFCADFYFGIRSTPVLPQ